jgi:6-phosphogluconolactonase (cycloisomerase 2 family)
MAFSLTNLFNITDNTAVELVGALGLATGKSGGKNLLFVAGNGDDGVTTFQITKSGRLKKVQALDDVANPAFELDGAYDFATVNVGKKSFLLATGQDDDGISSFEIRKTNGRLINRDNVDDTEHAALKLDGAAGAVTAKVGTSTFVVVAGPGAGENGLSVFRLNKKGILTNTHNVFDGGALELFAATDLAKATIDGTTYIFVAGLADDGVSVFSLGADGTLSNTDNVDDAADVDFLLDGVTALTTAVVGTRTFLFTAGFGDNGVSVFEVAVNGMLTNVDNVPDNGTLNLANADAVATIKIAGITYLFAGGFLDSGFSTFVVAADGTLINVDNVDDTDEPNFELTALGGLHAAKVGNKFLLFASGRQDDGVSVFKINPEGLGISGTAGNDIINATNAPPGEPLPSGLGDFISGGLGDDVLSGLGGRDTLFGGDDKDTLTGGKGGDRFVFTLPTESAVGINRDVVTDFRHTQHDKIDLQGIDANDILGANQAFKFIGAAQFTGVAGQLRFKNHVVQGDTDGDGTADFEIGVLKVAELVKGDFVL